MCGIAGIYNFCSQTPVREATIEAMLGQMAYRGPDDRGIYLQGPLGLGHLRLSILDTSRAGHQPMVSRDERTVLAYNGEVYNYVELARGLSRKGYQFRSHTDTEVILGKYEMEREKCLEDFIGMFAFSVWDSTHQHLLLARDRVGIKPLYWTLTHEGIVFASEIKALLVAPGVKKEMNTVALLPYLSLGHVPGETTMFQGIQKLLPGHFLLVADGKIRIQKYWDLVFASDGLSHSSSLGDRLDDLLTDAVKIHLRSDVPLGVFLSGGLDSSTIVSLVRQQHSGPLKTFSVAFDVPSSIDERHYARIVAREFETEHHELVLKPEEFKDLLPKFAWHMDEPVSEAAAIPLYGLAALARQHVKVVLSGEGADEIFGGYDIYRYMMVLEFLRSLISAIPFKVSALLAKRFGFPKGRRYSVLGALPLEQRYTGVSMILNDELREVCAAGLVNGMITQVFATEITKCYEQTKNWDYLSRMLYLDTKNWLPNDILLKADRMTMAHSLELRVPFLDHRVVEFGARLPSCEKIGWRGSKLLLKKVMQNKLPDQILTRRKAGFPTPIVLMFGGPLRSYAESRLKDGMLQKQGYVNKTFINDLFQRLPHANGIQINMLWRLLVLEEWSQAFSIS